MYQELFSQDKKELKLNEVDHIPEIEEYEAKVNIFNGKLQEGLQYFHLKGNKKNPEILKLLV